MCSSKGSGVPATPRDAAAAILLAAMAVTAMPLRAQAPTPPVAVPRLEMARLAGEWFEVAGTGAWSRRRCVADTRFLFSVRPDPRALDVATACTTAHGVERRRGRLRGNSADTGALRLRLVPRLFAPLPAVWDDFWVLAVGENAAWLLVGDRRRQSLAVLSRTVALDEAALAQALATSRSLAYDVGRLGRVAHPSGATGLKPSR